MREVSSKIYEIVEKTLHVSETHRQTYFHRSGRPYYPLDNGWGLTSLDTGALFFVNTEDRNITPWIIMGGMWEPNVGRVLIDYAKPGMTVLDIGAHFGYYTVKLAMKVGSSGTLFAFEPNPEVSAVCLENIKINGLAGMTALHQLALGDASGNAILTRSHSNMASANLVGDQDADFSVGVKVERLDDILNANVIVDLIKLDAEGYEKRILDGARAVLERSPNCAIMIELGLDRWERYATLEELLPLCGGNGRQAFAVQPDGTLKQMSIEEMRPFLLTCGFHENYFLIAHPHNVTEKIPDLLR